VIGAFTGIAGVATGIRVSGFSGAIVGALGAVLFATAVVLNSILVKKNEIQTDPQHDEARRHSLSIINTILGIRFQPFWRVLIVIFNVILVTISVTSALIRHELNAAWGCYSGDLPLSRLTGLVCTLDDAPELCFDVGEPRAYVDSSSSANAVSCTGSRSVSMQGPIWTPLAIFLAEWLLVAMAAYRHGDAIQLTDPDTILLKQIDEVGKPKQN
jgi:hypothetical protein